MENLSITKDELQIALKEAGDRATDTINKAIKTVNDEKVGKGELEAVSKELVEMKELHKTFTETAQTQIDEMEKRLAAKTVKLNDKEINLKFISQYH